MDAIVNFIFFECVFEEIESFEVFVGISHNGWVFEGDGGGREGLIEDEFIGGFS